MKRTWMLAPLLVTGLLLAQGCNSTVIALNNRITGVNRFLELDDLQRMTNLTCMIDATLTQDIWGPLDEFNVTTNVHLVRSLHSTLTNILAAKGYTPSTRPPVLTVGGSLNANLSSFRRRTVLPTAGEGFTPWPAGYPPYRVVDNTLEASELGYFYPEAWLSTTRPGHALRPASLAALKDYADGPLLVALFVGRDFSASKDLASVMGMAMLSCGLVQVPPEPIPKLLTLLVVEGTEGRVLIRGSFMIWSGHVKEEEVVTAMQKLAARLPTIPSLRPP